MATDKTDDLIISISTDLATVRRSLKRLESDIGRSTKVIENKFDVMSRGINRSIEATASRLASTFAAAFSVRAAQQFVDASTRITNALKVAGLQGTALTDVYDKLFASAQRNAAPVESLVTLYSRLALTQKELKVSQAELVGFADKVALALRVGGTSAADASGALLQLSQALGGGTVRAEEFNSVLEGAPTIVQAVASGLKEAGGSVAKLRQLVIDGKVSSQAFFRAFEAGATMLEDKVAGSTLTTSQSLEKLQNVLVKVAGQIDMASGASSKFAVVIEDLSATIQQFGDVVVRAADGDLGKFLGWLNDGIEKASAFKRIMGGIPGILDKMGKINQDILNGRPVGQSLSEDTIQGRINQAFETTKAAPKTGRLPALPAAREIKTVSIADMPAAGTGDKETKKAETAASRAKQAYDDLIKSANDRIGQLRLETELTGQYGTATDAARFRLDLLQQAEDKGRSLSQEQRAQIEEKVEAYRKYAEALSEAKLQQDLLDKARMAGLSQREQEVTRTLREYGLPEDLGSKNAGLIRDQLRTEEITSAADAFIDDFTGALLSGGDDIGKRLGQVILSALMDSAQQQLSTLLKQVFGALMNGGKGGAVGPAASVVSTLAAPVGKVTRAPLGGNKADFVNALLPSAIQEGARTGVDPRIIVAQAAQETGWGRSAPGNNYFGIKSHGLDGGQSLNTWEVINGKRVNVTDSFRQFASPADSVRGYGDFIMSNPRYAGFRSANGLDAQLSALQSSGYATDPNYSNSVGAIARSIELPSKNASAALEKLAGASTETTNGLGSLASSLASGASGIGGGGFNLASLLSPSFTPNTNIGNYLKGIPGFAKGTDNAPRGLAIVGEDGPELVHFRGGERVIPNKRISAPRAPTLRARSAANGNGAGSNSLTVNINGASGDPHVRELVRQGVQEALAGQSEQMRRGGFGDMQDRYVSQRR